MRHRTHVIVALGFGMALLLSGRGFAQARNWPSESPPRSLAAHEVTFPPYELKTLANGLQVISVMHHEQPAVSLRAIVRAGSAQDPPGRQGLGSLAAALLDQGTSSRSAQVIADTIDTVGGELETGSGRDLTFLRVLVMKDSFELGLNLLADVLRNPVFADQEIERQRSQLLSALKVSYDDPGYIADIVFDRLVYGFHPYGFPTSGTPESVQRITGEDLRTYHHRYFAPNNVILAVVGDVTSSEAFAAVERAFGDWARRDIATDHTPDPPDPARRVIVVDKPDAVQTEIRVGHLGIPRNDRDYTTVELMINILGGEGSNRLHRVLRYERGLTYGASAEMEALRQTGEFAAVTNTRSEATAQALRLIADEFARIRSQPVGERELADAKAYMTGHFPLRIETPEAIGTQVLDVLFYGLPLEQLQTLRKRVNDVSENGISWVAGDRLRPDRLSVVLVGNAASFVRDLRGAGFGKYELIPLGDLDLDTHDFRRPGSAAVASQLATGRAGRPQ